MPIPVSCQCGKSFNAGSKLAGKRVKCPSCGSPIAIPAAQTIQQTAAPNDSAAQNSPVVVACGCGQQFQAKPQLFGKTVKCPKCGNPLTISPPQATANNNQLTDPFAAPAAQANDPLADPLGSSAAMNAPLQNPLGDPLGNASSDPLFGAGLGLTNEDFNSVQQQPAFPQQPAFQPQTGPSFPATTSFPSATEPTSPTAPAPVRRSGSGLGGLVIGSVVSIVAAIIGAVIWVVIVVSTGFEIGYVAWGIGALVGTAMASTSGRNVDEGIAGIVAAVIAVLGILGAKLILFGMIALAISAGAGEVDDPEGQALTMGEAFMSLFGILDIIFIVLAAGTAYGICNHSGE